MKKLLIPLFIGLALLGITAAPAAAEAKVPTVLSMYGGYGYAGQILDLEVGSGCAGVGFMNNAASSLYNRHGITLRLYDATNCTGAYTTISSGQRVPDLRTWGWDNRIGSVRRN